MPLFKFLAWHYITAYSGIFKAWFNFIRLGLHLFSVPLLLRTLFAPWRRIEAKSRETGFSLQGFFDKLVFNTISRTIGFFVRSLLIFWGLLLALFFFILGLPLIILWFFLPLFSWVLYSSWLPRKKTKEELLRGEAKRFVYQRLGIKNEAELKQIKEEDVQAVLDWYLANKNYLSKKRKFWHKENLFRLPALGSDLAFGYTLELNKYSQDLSFAPAFSHQLVGREKEVKEIEAILSRSNQANLLIVGEPGVGRHTILLGLAKAIREKRVAPGLFFKRVLFLNMPAILGKVGLAASQGKSKFEELLKEAQQAGNVILVIKQIEEYISDEEGMDLTPAIMQGAESRGTQIIGVTTPEKFNQIILPNEEFLKYFEKTEVKPPDKKEALHILEQVLPDFEKGKRLVTSFFALKEIINQADSLITDIPFPEKAIDLLDQLITQAQQAGKKEITKQDVQKLISQKAKVPVGSLSKTEMEKLKNLEPVLHQRIVNQNLAITSLVKAMQRARVGVSETDKPIGSFLFLGPTGVGKTETAKALAEAYFGDEKRLVRFDMSQPFSLDLFLKEAREHPYSVLLLDEFEKADTETLHLFLTVFDEGYLKDKHGKVVSFKNMIIICTSNAAAEFIRQRVKTGLEPRIVTEHVLQKKIFSPELINRFDGVIIYQPLSLEHIKAVAQLMVKRLNKRLEKKELKLEADDQVYALLAEKGHSPQFGARPMQRLISDKIESLIAQKILDGLIKEGETLKLTVDEKTKEFKIEKYAKVKTS